jgi:outer membrane murein-binding lipoprotein Lpp
MKSTNLLIIGGAVALGGLYLSNKSKKAKAEANAQAELNAKVESDKAKAEFAKAQANLAKTQAERDKVLADAKIYNDAQDKIRADKALADKIKEDEKRKQEALLEASKHYTSVEAGVKAIDSITKANSLFDANPVTVLKDPFLTPSTLSLSNINLFYKNQDELKTRQLWKANYSSIYKDIKEYYTVLYKVDVDKISDILPRLIVAKAMDNFGQKGSKIFTPEDEIFMVDNNLDKEEILKNALKSNYNKLFTNNILLTTDLSKRIVVKSAIYGYGNRYSDVKKIVTDLIQKGVTSFTPNNSTMGGDPAYGDDKHFYITYSIDGNELSFNEVPEGALVTLLKIN